MLSQVIFTAVYFSSLALIYFFANTDLSDSRALLFSRLFCVQVIGDSKEDEETGFDRTRLEELWKLESEPIVTFHSAASNNNSGDQTAFRSSGYDLGKLLQFILFTGQSKIKSVRFHPQSIQHITFPKESYDRADPECVDRINEYFTNKEYRAVVVGEILRYKKFEMKTYTKEN